MKNIFTLALVATTFMAVAQKTYLPRIVKYKDNTKGVEIDSTQTSSNSSTTKKEKKDTVLNYKGSWIPPLSVKHIKGLKSTELYFTLTEHSIGAQGSFSHYIYKDLYLQYGGDYETGNIEYTTFNHYSAHALASYSIFNISNTVYFNTQVSGHFGYEQLTMSENNTSVDGLILETAINIETEVFIIPNLVISGVASQKVYTNSLLGSAYFEGMFGLKYIFD